MTNETDTDPKTSIVVKAIDLWRDGGPQAVSHGAVAAALDLSKGNVGYHFARADDLRRAAALQIVGCLKRIPSLSLVVGESGAGLPTASKEFTRDDLMVAEAVVWLVRNS